MYAPKCAHPLPLIAVTISATQRRRHHAGTIIIDPTRLLSFNARLERIAIAAAQLDADWFASVARQLLADPRARHAPPCVAERLRMAGVMEMMLDDLDWDVEASTRRVCRDVVDYLHSNAVQLIPNREHVVGRLDDAVLVEHARPRVEEEIRHYCDFRRLRQLEAELRGEAVGRFRFDRETYAEARLAEQQLHTHARRIGLGSYLPPPPPVSSRL